MVNSLQKSNIGDELFKIMFSKQIQLRFRQNNIDESKSYLITTPPKTVPTGFLFVKSDKELAEIR